MKHEPEANSQQIKSALPSATLLGRIGDDLEQERILLNGLAFLCEQGNEGRIAHEIGKASQALTAAIELIKLYESGEKLPTLAEMRGILVPEVSGNKPEDFRKIQPLTKSSRSAAGSGPR